MQLDVNQNNSKELEQKLECLAHVQLSNNKDQG